MKMLHRKDKEYISKLVEDYPTKFEQGFTALERGLVVIKIQENFKMNMDNYNDALSGITGMMIDGNIIIYHQDLYHALVSSIEDRGLYAWEWD